MCNRLLVFDPVCSRCVHAVKKRCWLAPIFISDEKERPSNKIKAPGSRNSPCLSTRLLFLFFSSTAAFSDFSLSLLFLVFFFVFFPLLLLLFLSIRLFTFRFSLCLLNNVSVLFLQYHHCCIVGSMSIQRLFYLQRVNRLDIKSGRYESIAQNTAHHFFNKVLVL